MIDIIKFLSNYIIGGCIIGGKGARYISEALKINSTLKKLDLAENSLYDKGASFIAQALKENKGLNELSLSNITKWFISQKLTIIGGNDIKVQGLLKISEALKVNATLESLNLCNKILMHRLRLE